MNNLSEVIGLLEDAHQMVYEQAVLGDDPGGYIASASGSISHAISDLLEAYYRREEGRKDG